MSTATELTVGDSAEIERLFGPLDVPEAISTPALIRAMLDAHQGISDLIFSPGKAPQAETHGELTPIEVPELGTLKPEDTARIARDLIGSNEQAIRTLRDHGACDFSYSLPDRARFRVNVFRQRGTFAAVMRVISPR